jgi:hypothetical protein
MDEERRMAAMRCDALSLNPARTLLVWKAETGADRPFPRV